MEETFWNYTPAESGRRHGLGGSTGKDDDDDPMLLLTPDGNTSIVVNISNTSLGSGCGHGPTSGSSAPVLLGASPTAPFVTVEVLPSAAAAGISAHGMRSRRHTSASSVPSGITSPAGDVGNDADESDAEENLELDASLVAEDLGPTGFTSPAPCKALSPTPAHADITVEERSREVRSLLGNEPTANIRQAILADLGRLRHKIHESTERSANSLVHQVGSWFSCLFGHADQGSSLASASSSSSNSFEINFEDIRELKWLGSGAHGCVFLGQYKGEEVAVKKFREKGSILQEVRLLKELKHDNIVELKGVCSKDPVYALVMSYCPRSLYDVLQARRVPPSLVLEWAKQIATGMDYLHEKGIIHRDLKSPNVLVAQDQRTLKISDFGTSMEMPLKSTKMSFKGTCAWMAPELLRGEKCGPKVDVYSFGVCLWELLTSEVPYHGVDVGAVIWGVGSGRLSLPVPESTPDGFTLLLNQCWNKEGRHRPAFRQILMHLSILQTDTEFAATPDESYFQTQLRWKKEIQERFEEMKRFEDSARHKHDELLRRREEELSHVRDVRELYETRLAEVLQLHSELQLSLRRCQDQEAQLSQDLDARRRNSNEFRRRKNSHHHHPSASPHGRISGKNVALDRRRRKPSQTAKETQVLRKSTIDVRRLQEELEQSLQDVVQLRLDDGTDEAMVEA